MENTVMRGRQAARRVSLAEWVRFGTRLLAFATALLQYFK
jgi:hypothetical protein